MRLKDVLDSRVRILHLPTANCYSSCCASDSLSHDSLSITLPLLPHIPDFLSSNCACSVMVACPVSLVPVGGARLQPTHKTQPLLLHQPTIVPAGPVRQLQTAANIAAESAQQRRLFVRHCAAMQSRTLPSWLTGLS